MDLENSFEIEFEGVIFEWRGPAPYYFVSIQGINAVAIKEQAAIVSYGWGMIPVACKIGNTLFKTSLWPKGDEYYLPLKDAVRRAESLSLDESVAVKLSLNFN